MQEYVCGLSVKLQCSHLLRIKIFIHSFIYFVSECFDIDSIVDDMDRKFLQMLFP